MAWHLYLVPVIGTGFPIGDPPVRDPRRPKYVADLGVLWAAMDYGFQPVMLVAADVDDLTDTSLQVNADVTKVPDALDNQIGAVAISIVQNALEIRHLPAGWVTTDITYRVLLRTLAGFFAFVQRYATVANTTALVFGGAVDLNTRVNQLPVAVRQNLQATATSLGLDATGISGSTTLRVVLKNIADQWGQRSFQIGEITV